MWKPTAFPNLKLTGSQHVEVAQRFTWQLSKGFGDATKSMGFSAPCLLGPTKPTEFVKIPDFATSIILDESIGTPPPGNSLLWPHEQTYDMGGLSQVVTYWNWIPKDVKASISVQWCNDVEFIIVILTQRIIHVKKRLRVYTCNICALRFKWNLQTEGPIFVKQGSFGSPKHDLRVQDAWGTMYIWMFPKIVVPPNHPL